MDGDKTFEELENMTEAKLRRSREENDRRLAEEAKKAQAEAERRAAQDLHSRDGDPKDNDSEEENRFSGNH
jgi:hypothetical protein